MPRQKEPQLTLHALENALCGRNAVQLGIELEDIYYAYPSSHQPDGVFQEKDLQHQVDVFLYTPDNSIEVRGRDYIPELMNSLEAALHSILGLGMVRRSISSIDARNMKSTLLSLNQGGEVDFITDDDITAKNSNYMQAENFLLRTPWFEFKEQLKMKAVEKRTTSFAIPEKVNREICRYTQLNSLNLEPHTQTTRHPVTRNVRVHMFPNIEAASAAYKSIAYVQKEPDKHLGIDNLVSRVKSDFGFEMYVTGEATNLTY